ncbi:MAG: hypothetical protein E5Y06_12930 [Mesorhizobium sp.]|nr:MAG: hypothetical protein E5Y06_12930 [Mesorhizobium sp.]TJV00451.1 MAG: hypothetical protein E5Y08_03735 [Mesorhizobium sp.]TJV17688.1 MAG: hypothetical protein E5Y07_11395 [Mesorhizobium sp.]
MKQLLGRVCAEMLAEAPPVFVIHGRSKERSDAAQTRGSMPRPFLRGAAEQNSATWQHFEVRHGSSGLPAAASRLLRPWMTKLGKVPAVTHVKQVQQP